NTAVYRAEAEKAQSAFGKLFLSHLIGVADDVSQNLVGVDAHVGACHMGALAVDSDGQLGGSRHKRTCLCGDDAYLLFGPYMIAEDLCDIELVELAAFDYRLCAADTLLGRLEYENYIELVFFVIFCQIVGQSEEHGHMTVVAAGVHKALVGRF